MNLSFNLSIDSKGILCIQDTTQEYNEYLEENSDFYIRLGRFKYSDTNTINVIKYVSSNQIQILKTIITKHKIDGEIAYLDEAYYELNKDGHYLIEHIVLPTVEWFNEHKNDPIINEYTGLYLTDGNFIYKYSNNRLEKCDIEEITEIDTDKTSISKSTQETFSIELLYKCYLEQCKKRLDVLSKQDCSDTSNNSLFDLNLLQLSIAAIKYNVEFGYLNQAQCILERITKCGNLCNQSKKIEYYGCPSC